MFWAVLILLLVFFGNADSKYYLHEDAKIITKWSNIALVILSVVIACLMLIIFRKHVDSWQHAVLYLLIIIVRFSIAAFFLHGIFGNIGLFVNRQFSTGQIQKHFVITHLNGDTIGLPIYYSIASRQIFTDDNDIISSQTKRHKIKDTVAVNFTRGLFGVEYFNYANNAKHAP